MVSRMPARRAEIRREDKRDTRPAWCLASVPHDAAARAAPLAPSARAKLKRETARTPTMSKSAPEFRGRMDIAKIAIESQEPMPRTHRDAFALIAWDRGRPARPYDTNGESENGRSLNALSAVIPEASGA
jgi:hypothetical protein